MYQVPVVGLDYCEPSYKVVRKPPLQHMFLRSDISDHESPIISAEADLWSLIFRTFTVYVRYCNGRFIPWKEFGQGVVLSA